MKKIFVLILLNILTCPLWACEFAFPESFSLASSPKDEEFFAYQGNRSVTDIPVLRVFNCKTLAISNKFLMVAWGPQNDFFTDRQAVFDFSNNYEDRGCSIAGSRFKDVHNTQRRKSELQQKWDFIKSCYEISITEETNFPLNSPANQPGCEVKKNGLYNMTFNGGYCYVKPSILSSYLIRFNLKDECRSFEKLGKLKLTYSDINTTLNFYSSGDATGTSQDLTALANRPIRLTSSPSENLIKTSDDFGILLPQFPANYILPDIHAGRPEAQLNGDKTRILLPLWVDNNCAKKCQGDLCQSACDYAQPIAANFELYENSTHNKFEFLTSWYDGGTVQAHFQGEIAGLGEDVATSLIEVGKIYRIRAVFDDPKFDFEKLKGQLKSKISRMQQTIPRMQGGHINDLPPIPNIQDTQTLPFLAGITPLNFAINNSNTLDRANQELRRYLDFKVWPPYFENICSQTGLCRGIDNSFLELIVDFEIEGLGENNLYKTKVLQVKRSSTYLENYADLFPKMPYISCPAQ